MKHSELKGKEKNIIKEFDKKFVIRNIDLTRSFNIGEDENVFILNLEAFILSKVREAREKTKVGENKRIAYMQGFKEGRKQTLDTYKQQLIGEVRKMKRKSGAINGRVAVYMTDEPYNNLLDDIIDLIQEGDKK